ncbi:MAG: hypothetical protein JWM11_7456, partial [Planctomycetaceae bacterium]|nr:hypothetical protein [Planctomycetaceae bacterium]
VRSKYKITTPFKITTSNESQQMLQHQAQREASRIWFFHWTTWCLIAALFLPVLGGCFGEKQRKGGASRGAGGTIDPEDITGHWKLSIANRGAQSDICLLACTYDAKRREDKYSIGLFGVPEAVAQSISVKSTKVGDDGSVDFEIEWPNKMVSSFSGRLDGEAIWGSYWDPHFQLVPAKMERTELDKLEKPDPVPVSHAEDFMKAKSSNDSYVAMETLADKANRSPLMFEIYENLASHFKKETFSKEKVEEFLEKYRKSVEIWGARLAPLVDLNVGHALAKQELYPELAQSLLESTEGKLTENHPLEFKAKLVDAWILLGKPDKALKWLPKLQQEAPTSPELMWLYARAKEKANATDEALLAYTKVAVYPGYEQQIRSATTDLPSQSAVRLWKAKHEDSTKGFDEYAQQAYLELLKLFVPKRTVVKRDAKAMVPMIEMFTSNGSAPCIAAEVAIESLRHCYSNQEVVLLKYQEHNPYVDPLSNESSAKRLSYYGLSETPSLVFNGQTIDRPDLPFSVPNAMGAGQIIGLLRAGVEAESKQTSSISIQLTATRKGDEIQIKADVSGISNVQHQPRLYLALVENGIFYPGPNGILFHDCVVRTFAGGTKGLALPKGDSSHAETIVLSQLRQELLAHLSQFETERKLPLKPTDFKKLQVAAFVQPNFTKVVLQSALVDVTGDAPPEDKPEPKAEPKTEPKAESKPDSKPEEQPKPDEQPKSEDKPNAEEKPKSAEKPTTEKPATEEKPKAEQPAEEKPAAKTESPKPE